MQTSAPATMNETPGEKVFYNSLIIDNIYASGLGKADLVKCAVLCKGGLTAAAKGLYKKVPRDIMKRLVDKGCPFVSFISCGLHRLSAYENMV